MKVIAAQATQGASARVDCAESGSVPFGVDANQILNQIIAAEQYAEIMAGSLKNENAGPQTASVYAIVCNIDDRIEFRIVNHDPLAARADQQNVVVSDRHRNALVN